MRPPREPPGVSWRGPIAPVTCAAAATAQTLRPTIAEGRKAILRSLLLFVCAALLGRRRRGRRSPTGGCVGKVRLRGPLWDTTNAALEPGLDVALDEIARVIREECEGDSIVIEAHAFELPSAALNLKLSELRVTLVVTSSRSAACRPRSSSPSRSATRGRWRRRTIPTGGSRAAASRSACW